MWKKTLSDFEKMWLFLWNSSLFLKGKKCAIHISRETTQEINSLKNQKHLYLINTWSDVQNW